MKSILSNEKECFICGLPEECTPIHKHHVFMGYNRKNSEKYGCWVYLCARHHNMSDEGVHFNLAFCVTLQKYCQEKWESINGDREQFRSIFGKSYL
jgi:hypothetical protein